MKPFALAGGILLCCLLTANAGAEKADDQSKAKIIPLDQIWAYEMPGTRDIRNLEPKRATGNLSTEALIRDSLVLQIRRTLQNRPKPGEKAGPAFVVVGTEKEALKNAHAVMVAKDEKEPPRLLPANTDLSLVFYAYTGGRYVRLDSVEKSERLIVIKYHLESHSTANATIHFALIPIGKLPVGAVQVKIEQLPPTDEKGQPLPMRDERHIVCDSFTFAAEKQ
jgi:hypothetical protein